MPSMRSETTKSETVGEAPDKSSQERQVWRGGKAYPMAPGEQTEAEAAPQRNPESVEAKTRADRLAFRPPEKQSKSEKTRAILKLRTVLRRRSRHRIGPAGKYMPGQSKGYFHISLTKCPKCGSTEIIPRHLATTSAVPECYFDHCENCGHDFNQT
jgi:DNA-directed RNA polymerase subunit M/transcription elongation factor TFIIS